MVLGPLSTVANALALAPEIESKIEKIVWMGGALDVAGNIVPAWNMAQDGTAEWNGIAVLLSLIIINRIAFWDPPAVAKVLGTKLPIHAITLDVTNRVPVTSTFMRAFSRDRRLYPLYDFAGLCYSLVAYRSVFSS